MPQPPTVRYRRSTEHGLHRGDLHGGDCLDRPAAPSSDKCRTGWTRHRPPLEFEQRGDYHPRGVSAKSLSNEDSSGQPSIFEPKNCRHSMALAAPGCGDDGEFGDGWPRLAERESFSAHGDPRAVSTLSLVVTRTNKGAETYGRYTINWRCQPSRFQRPSCRF